MNTIRNLLRRATALFIHRPGHEPPILPGLEQAFWAHVEKSKGCWLWRGRTSRGYGVLVIRKCMGKQEISALRASWIITHGSIDARLRVFHTGNCNKKCVNPSHLSVGSPRDCSLHMRSIGKTRPHTFEPQPGEQNAAAKLTWSAVLEIRAKNAGGVSQRALAREYGVHRNTIHQIVHGRLWRADAANTKAGKKGSDIHETVPKNGVRELDRPKAQEQKIL